MRTHTFRYFFIPYLLFLILAMIQVLVAPHGSTVLWLNTMHNPLFDFFFKIWTYGGDGFFYVIATLALLIWHRRHGYIFALAGVVQGLVTLFMKQVLFKGTPRPRKYFEGMDVLEFVDGVKVHEVDSFPSGHAVSAFVIATFFSLMVGRKEWSVLLLLGAILVAVSRMYLNQHFLVDVKAGSMIGVAIAVLFYKIFDKYLRQEKPGLI